MADPAAYQETFGGWYEGSWPPSAIALWEFALGVWLVVKGFNPSPITAGMAATSDMTPAR